MIKVISCQQRKLRQKADKNTAPCVTIGKLYFTELISSQRFKQSTAGGCKSVNPAHKHDNKSLTWANAHTLSSSSCHSVRLTISSHLLTHTVGQGHHSHWSHNTPHPAPASSMHICSCSLTLPVNSVTSVWCPCTCPKTCTLKAWATMPRRVGYVCERRDEAAQNIP